jgi:hypothetical protein
MEQFNIPVTLFFFKREYKTLQVLERISKVKPRKLYLISDGPRNDEERVRVSECREKIEGHINWDCEIIKNYAEVNKGVYDRIGLGAKWVLGREETAIFLEDDNLPELTFFQFCAEMLERYKHDTRVLWICGTNYLKEYEPVDGSSYVFTKHMLPCGWASWGSKFNKFYDGELHLWNDSYIKKRIKFENDNKSLLRQDIENWNRESRRILNGERPLSWDFQMSFTQRVHGLYAIVPKFNQITNIGVDLDSIHGGISFDNEMVKRFCGLKTKSMNFPLIHPKVLLSDKRFDKLTAQIIILPFTYRVKVFISKILKKIFFIKENASFTSEMKEKLGFIIKSSKQ